MEPGKDDMPREAGRGGGGGGRSNLWTAIAVAIVAYAACDMAHEVLGHGVACLLVGVRPLSLSTVALQTGTSSRLVAAAGSIANVVMGIFALWLFRRGGSFDTGRYFLWLFGSINLLNGTGYLLFSGLLDIGDWGVVISGRHPHWAWRAFIAAAGAALYIGAVRLIARSMVSLVRKGAVDRRDPGRLVFPAYIAGGLLLVAGSALNRIDPSLVLTSGVSSGFGAMAGLVLVPRIVERRTKEVGSAGATPPLAFSPRWIVAGALVALVFVLVLGPGVRLS